MNRSRHESTEEVQRQTREAAQNMFTDEPETMREEFDVKELFARILEKEDWTDKVVSGVGKIRSMFHRSHGDVELPEELRLLIPDMRQVGSAYEEMTRGYKDFIRDVWEAMRMRRSELRENSLTEDASQVDPE